MWKNEGSAKKFSCFHALWLWLVIFVSSICCCGKRVDCGGARGEEEEGVGEVKSDVEREGKKKKIR